MNVKGSKKTVILLRDFQQYTFEINNLRIIQEVDLFRKHVYFYKTRWFHLITFSPFDLLTLLPFNLFIS